MEEGAQQKNRGFSLIELMIVMALSSILMLAIYSLFDIQQYGFQIVNSLNDREDDAQIALTLLADDIRMVDYWGGVSVSELELIKGTLKSPGSCQHQWIFDHRSILGIEGKPSIQEINNLPASCLAVRDYRENSDMLALRFADSRNEMSDALIDNKRYTKHYFVRAQVGEKAVIFQGNNWQQAQIKIPDHGLHHTMVFNSYLYFLKPCDQLASSCLKSTNVLTRLVLKGDRYIQEGLVENIEDMQFEYGIDEDSSGEVNRYVSAEEVVQWHQVLSVRIFLLVRNRMMDRNIDELGKPYLMGTEDSVTTDIYTVPESGRYFSRVRYVKDVAIRNRLLGG